MTKKPLKSTRPLLGYEDEPQVKGEGRYQPVPGKFVDTVLCIFSQTLTDQVSVNCNKCGYRSTFDRLVKARQFMRDHFLFFAKKDDVSHSKFNLRCRVNLSRRYRYWDASKAADHRWLVQVEE